MYKLAGFDLDGTLLNNHWEISEYSYNKLGKISKIITPVIVTGRGFNSANKFFENKNINIDIICNNGNVIRNSLTKELYYINEIDKIIALDVLNEASNEANIYPLVHINALRDGYDIVTIKKCCTEHVRSYPEGFGKRALYLDDFNNLEHGVLSIVFAGEYNDLIEFKEILLNKYKDLYNIHLLEVKSKNLYIIEVLQKTGNKWSGIEEYLKIKGISKKETIAVGDDYNDISMIKNSGLGIAMKNSSELVKDSSDIITEFDNDYDGAVREVLKLIK